VIGEVVLGVIAIIVGVGVILKLIREDLIYGYFVAIGVLIALPFVLGFKLLKGADLIFHLLLNVLWIILKAFTKGLLFLLIITPLAFIMLISNTVPYIGERVLKFDSWVRDTIDFSGLAEETRSSRRMMVEIVAEEDSRVPEFNEEEEFREAMKQAKERGKRKLSVGESVLSVGIGGILLASQFYGFSLFQTRLFGVTTAFLIQVGLFVITVSILYRVPILSFLAFSGDEEFSSPQEWDAALSYQKAISQVGIMQIFSFIFVLARSLSKADSETIQKALNERYEGTFTSSMKIAWREIRQSQEADEND
jgi:hypothetical protein